MSRSGLEYLFVMHRIIFIEEEYNWKGARLQPHNWCLLVAERNKFRSFKKRLFPIGVLRKLRLPESVIKSGENSVPAFVSLLKKSYNEEQADRYYLANLIILSKGS
jgi:hypothetical protein